MDHTESLLVPVPRAAEILGIGKSKTYELIGKGEIATVRIGRAVRVPVAELERFVAALIAD